MYKVSLQLSNADTHQSDMNVIFNKVTSVLKIFDKDIGNGRAGEIVTPLLNNDKRQLVFHEHYRFNKQLLCMSLNRLMWYMSESNNWRKKSKLIVPINFVSNIDKIAPCKVMLRNYIIKNRFPNVHQTQNSIPPNV